ncbi:WRKY transcription factor 19 [Hirschfeldia incana]|nr:WRKY transcription factor 19 [Hirschfeldia incana]
MLQPRAWKLRFLNSPPPTILTFSRIEAEDGTPIAIELVDAATNARVTTFDLRLEIVALNADITTEESFTAEEFNRNILRPREGKPPPLVGDLNVTLKDGVGVVSGDVTFTENSSWTKSRMFRLGAKVTQGGVVEAISRAFVCREPPGGGESAYADCKVDDMSKHGVTESSSPRGNPSNQQKQRRRELKIRGHRPSPLSINKDSYMINKPPKLTHRDPVVVYNVSPKVVHTTLTDFRNVVHRLTGVNNPVSELQYIPAFGPPVASSAPTDYEVIVIYRRGDISNDTFVKVVRRLTGVPNSVSDLKNSVSVPLDSFVEKVSSKKDTEVSTSAIREYDVVIRYMRGCIGNDDFVSHLRAALCRRGVSVGEDTDEEDAVPECRVLIIFLTSTYLPSNLVNIVKQQSKKPRVVYPILYGISPSDLITYSKCYERFFLQNEPKRWQAALEEISQMHGYILTDKSESELINEIVRDSLKVVRSNNKNNMIGINMQIKEILSLLCVESPDVRRIGIWGTVGIGKTAIAEEIFHRISVHYETCVFLKDFQKEVELKGYDAVREELLSKLLEVEPDVVRTTNFKTSFLKSRLQRKSALVVLDNVNDFRDVETFVGMLSYLGPRSRIIITSRNRHVFVLCKTDHVYEVKQLDFSNSLQLLDRATFQSDLSHELYKTLSFELVKFSNGNPQVLQFLSRSNREWKSLSQEIQKSSAIYIPGIFERSCCGLDDNEKSIFLDIACFFRRMNKDNVAMLLDGCGFSAHIGFKNLVDKSLLTISHNMVDMLKFLQATGREIVRQESVDRPGDRSRLWKAEDIMDVFTDKTGTSAVEGIFLDISQLKFDASPSVFDRMCNLRLLKFYFSEVIENHGVSLPQGLEYLPNKLRLLHWEHYPMSSLPQCFDPKNLVELNLPNSCVNKLWKGKKSLENLKKMRLSYSDQLTKLPKLKSARNLELLDLEGCKSLVSISQSICHLKKLVSLNLKDCSNLESVPSTVELESLEVLNLSGCSKLETFPEISQNVKELYLGGTMLQEIPSSIKNLGLLEKLDLENSRNLVNLPTSICKLRHLETLNLSGCSSLERFPDLSRKMKCLKALDLSRTAIKELPASISYLTALEEVRIVGCKSLVRLPNNAWSLRFKVEFRQIDIEKFSKVWNRFGWLKKVQIS